MTLEPDTVRDVGDAPTCPVDAVAVMVAGPVKLFSVTETTILPHCGTETDAGAEIEQ